jgi:hypothetical protein
LVQVPFFGGLALLQFCDLITELAGVLRLGDLNMSSVTLKLRLVAALTALLALAISSGCKGFFVNQPNSIAVTQAGSSTLAVAVGTPQQLTATATYNSGTKDVTKSASWASSSACATVGTNTGLVTATGPSSSVTITATLAGVQGSITGSTTGGSAQTLTITPPATIIAGSTGQFSATLNSADVTSSSTWTSSDTTLLTFSTTTPGLATFVASGTVTVTASTTSSGTCASGSTSVTIP